MTRMFTQDRTGRRYPFPPKETTMSTMTGEQSVRRALNTLLHRFEQVRALDWPLTARDAQALIDLARKHIRLAEQHLDAGNPVVAQAAVSVGYSAIITLGSLHELETMEH